MARIPPPKRPHYTPSDRMAILELRTQRGWSTAKAARAFLLCPLTLALWMTRLNDQGPDALVRIPEPVNRFPEFVSYLAKRLKCLCPIMGKKRIAQSLARAGLHVGVSTVGRMLKKPTHPPAQSDKAIYPTPKSKPRVVTARYPNHLWHVDLTVAPTRFGLWTHWLPFAVLQQWPFAYWIAAVKDHFSRRIMAIKAYKRQPSAADVVAFLDEAAHLAGGAPKYTVTDHGPQFFCEAFLAWCRGLDVGPRFGAIGKYGSLAVIERFFRSFKDECLRRLPVIPLRIEDVQVEIDAFRDWFNGWRPHQSLGGKTPDELYFHRFPANRKPRFEPRLLWPRGSPCARPWALVKGRCGTKVRLDLAFHEGRPHLPIVMLSTAA